MPDVVVVGAGMVGAACAYHCARAGLSVAVVDRAGVAGGTTGSGEGNILTSDKEEGPEFELGLYSRRQWLALADELDGRTFELERKGGLAVSLDEAMALDLFRTAASQQIQGIVAQVVSGRELKSLEPHLTPNVSGAVYYPEDLQVNPMQAAARLVRGARDLGAEVWLGVDVVGFIRSPAGDGPVRGVRTNAPDCPEIYGDWVINSAGPWAGSLSSLAGADLPIEPRRGVILVAERLPAVVHRKVYGADYRDTVISGGAGVVSSPVIEATKSGTVLIGSTRERVGFDQVIDASLLDHLARAATRYFPVLEDCSAIRYYAGFRPYSPDNLPMIGPDPRVPGLVQACGHEGSGIGLSAGTGAIVADLILGQPTGIEAAPFRPERFEEGR